MADLEDETSARCKKIVEDLQSWRSELLESGLSEASGRSHVNQQLDIAMNAAKKLFEARLYELRGNSYSFEGSRTDLLEKNMESTKRRWLDSVLQVMQAFPMPKGKLSPSIIQEGYRIMDMLLKDVMRLGLLSERNLSYFLNNNANAQIILSHAFKKWLGKPHMEATSISLIDFIKHGEVGVESQMIRSESRFHNWLAVRW
jgi:hypothetical protein